MKNKPNYTELVQMYLAHELNDIQRDAFETKLKNDKLLRIELNLQKRLEDFILDDDLENFKLGLDRVYDNLPKKHSVKRYLIFGKASLIAASVLVLISLSIMFFNSKNNVFSGDEIFNQYYEGYPSSFTTRTGEVSLKDSQFLIALEHYKIKNFKEAKISLISVRKSYPDNIASKFYLGIVDIELGEFKDAIIFFDEVIQSKDQFYTEQSEWHKALCLVKLELKSKAIRQLNSIVEQKGFYLSRAEEILSRLE